MDGSIDIIQLESKRQGGRAAIARACRARVERLPRCKS